MGFLGSTICPLEVLGMGLRKVNKVSHSSPTDIGEWIGQLHSTWPTAETKN
jgi:hypothetical protein